MAESDFFSYGVEQFLPQIQPRGGRIDHVVVPQNLPAQDARRNQKEPLHDWFVRLISLHCNKDPNRVELEENIAIFAQLRWSNYKLRYANIQTIITGCDLVDYLNQGGDATYLRLDFDDQSLGAPFTHPLAHIHVEGESNPRFALEGGDSGNIIVDYLEFIYRNYAPSMWYSWAKRTWNGRFPNRTEAFDTIINAFKDSQFQILQNESLLLAQIKQVLRQHKDKTFPFHMNGKDRVVLEYPLARQE